MILHCVSCSNTWLSTRRTIPQHEMTDKLANALASHHPLQSECVIMCEQNRTQLDMFVFPSSFRSTTTTTYFCRHCWLDSRGLILQSNDRLAGPVHSQIGRNIVVSILLAGWALSWVIECSSDDAFRFYRKIFFLRLLFCFTKL